jgi:DNA-directed RNA polymerase subunit alpha
LLKHLRLIAGFTLVEEPTEAMEEEEAAQGLPSEVYDMALDQLHLSTRVFNALRRAGVKNVGEVMEMLDEGGEDALLAVRNVGAKSLDEIREALEEADLLKEIGGP